MIIEGSASFPGVSGMLVGVPAVSVANASSIGIDLNPDFGTGASPRKSPILGQGGEDLVVVCRVIQAFAAGAGTPIAQFHLAVSNATPGGFLLQGSPDYIMVGSSPGSQQLVSAIFYMGFVAAQLPLNATVFIRLNPYSLALGRNTAGTAIQPRNLRSFGVVMSIVNYATAGNPFFSAGAIQCFAAKAGDVFSSPQDFTYPSAVVNVG